MDYHLVQKPNPQNRSAPYKHYAQLVLGRKITLRTFAQEIVTRSSLTIGDVESCLESLIDLIPFFLLMGHPVKLGEFCTLRPSVRSYGAETLADWSTDLIKDVKIIFTPNTLMKERMRKEASFRLVGTPEDAEKRRVSRAEALLKNPKYNVQLLQNHIEAMSEEQALLLLQALTQKVQNSQKLQEDAPNNSDAPKNNEAPEKK